MTVLRLKYVHRYRDRTGRLRHYFRRDGKSVALPGQPGSAAFSKAYAAALEASAIKAPIGADRTMPGSMSALVVSYYQSAAFKRMKASSREKARRILDGFREAHGHRLVRELRPVHVRKLLDAKADTPSAANNLLKALRAILRHAVEYGLRDDDPTHEVRKLRERGEGYATWTEDDIATYLARHPSGTRPRLALALMLYTGLRRGDAVTLGRQHLRAGRIAIRQQKTGSMIDIPLHPELALELATVPEGQLIFLVTHTGAPFTAAGFGNYFRECCDAAGLPKCSAHGLRKAMARRLAEAGATPNEIKSITGHSSLSEVERYTRDASKSDMADTAMSKLVNRDKP